MDAKSSNKRQKSYEGDGKNEDIDKIISDLPDEMLQKIITYISIKEAVATSILSKRWKDQWIGNYKSNMELNEDLFSKREDFIDFVEKLYVACNNPKKFCLLFQVDNEFGRVIKWLSAFVNPKIEELNLELYGINEPLVLPNHFFTSNTLTTFELSMRQVIKIPSSTIINFQNLVTLTLKDVIFPNHHCTQKFFLGLPSLKELTLIDCDLKMVGSLTIICEVLEKLFIRDWANNEEEEEEEEDDFEFEVEVENHHHGEIGFHAPKLLTFSYIGDLINYYFLFSTTSITNASIEVNENTNSILQADYFVPRIFRSLNIGVERLSISDFALEALFEAPNFAANIRKFYHLLVLRVASSSPLDLAGQGLQTILQHSRILQEIEFDVEFTFGVFLDENEINPLPACFEKHLKIIKIHGFCGAATQLNAIKFLLKTTQVLERLYIHKSEYYFESHEGRRELERFYLQILGFPKASLGCIINLE